ncbi:nuclear transport factor 2 family protein [Listeria booriae]|uniref:nuclear transport factor 2 family protein n=1 Tax=Listeria booriae TaxID=1552123 RepID=UPI001625E3AF|nr:nuclear transport factor 2 family protein [Listeria booriae]MBC2173265.1 nuclear transport factor 2 family protein [Listeria booriae]
MNATYKQLVEAYFNGWISQNKQQILDTLSEDIYVEECYGPCYSGKKQITTWLDNWFKQGEVLLWNITEEWFDQKKDTYMCKWQFECLYKEEKGRFDGMSIITFANNQIKTIEEFQTTAKHEYPY